MRVKIGKVICTSFLIIAFSSVVSAAGIPVFDPGAPIKISENKSYSCDKNGNALQVSDGVKVPMHHDNRPITCHNDNLWFNDKPLSFIDLMGFSAKEYTTKNFNYEMTQQAGTEKIQPAAVFDNGIATFIKFKPEQKTLFLDGKKVPTPPNLMVSYVNENGKEVVASDYEWNAELNILSFPFVAKEWRIRAGEKVVGIRKSEALPHP